MYILPLHIVFFNDTATPEIYTLSLHDALPICQQVVLQVLEALQVVVEAACLAVGHEHHAVRALEHELAGGVVRSEEHTSELQSRQYLVCRLLLEKKTELQ